MKYLVFLILFTIASANYDKNTNSFTNEREVSTLLKDESVRLHRERRDDDDDYSDEGGFVSKPGHSGDDDFITNIQDCASGSTRAPWGKCLPCDEYKRIFKRLGMGC